MLQPQCEHRPLGLALPLGRWRWESGQVAEQVARGALGMRGFRHVQWEHCSSSSRLSHSVHGQRASTQPRAAVARPPLRPTHEWPGMQDAVSPSCTSTNLTTCGPRLTQRAARLTLLGITAVTQRRPTPPGSAPTYAFSAASHSRHNGFWLPAVGHRLDSTKARSLHKDRCPRELHTQPCGGEAGGQEAPMPPCSGEAGGQEARQLLLALHLCTSFGWPPQ